MEIDRIGISPLYQKWIYWEVEEEAVIVLLVKLMVACSLLQTYSQQKVVSARVKEVCLQHEVLVY